MTAIDIHSDRLALRVLTLGATLAQVRLTGLDRNLVLGFADPQDHLNIPVYAGAVVGPVANRVSGGCVVLNGNRYQMELNEGGQTALHSGAAGLHACDWTPVRQADHKVTLQTQLSPGACGLPGTRVFEVTYQIDADSFAIDIRATSDRATPINAAAHPYWNLDGTENVQNHHLHLYAHRYTPVGAANLPTGEVRGTHGTPFDFDAPRPIPLTPDLDVNYCLSDATRATPQPAAVLTGSDGTTLELATTAPGLQVYNGAHLPTLDGVLTDGKDLRPCGGIALEPQGWPDAPTQPTFPQFILQPGQVWQQRSTYSLRQMPASTKGQP